MAVIRGKQPVHPLVDACLVHSVHGLWAARPCIELQAGPIDIFPSPIRDPSKASSGRVPHPFPPGRKRWGLGSYRPSGVDSSGPKSISNAQCRSEQNPQASRAEENQDGMEVVANGGA